ncbi:hypothetical protein GobsT_22130 [Gemmata obscuriglobus]|uniref:hypothetical protein n=1 Tax=Gemmata obscuriglobus TaxID=114 RepID=UPI0011CD1047|nr:hypothetical protein [Gemmata obscuriglobus]QEG27457.1 hypothetical protein GobsT_22130 [Gemmata obscuriglobus]VTS04433.1 unnamed protein product [Gemmata obscuriglobus UQM 2246]
MGVPTGEVVARPMVARACGCLREFQHYAVDRYRAQRLAKFQKTRCEVCVAKLNEEQRVAASAVPKKGEAFKLLPADAHFSLTRKADASWTGTLAADGSTVEATGDGPHGLTLALARAWLAGRGITASPDDAPADKPTAAAPEAKPAPSGPVSKFPAPKPPPPSARPSLTNFPRPKPN